MAFDDNLDLVKWLVNPWGTPLSGSDIAKFSTYAISLCFVMWRARNSAFHEGHSPQGQALLQVEDIWGGHWTDVNVFVDAAIRGDFGIIAILVLDRSGVMIEAATAKRKASSPFAAELEAFHWGCCRILQSGWHNASLFSDCQQVVKGLAAGFSPEWRARALFDDTLNLLNQMPSCHYHWIPRRSNSGAHNLAAWAASCSSFNLSITTHKIPLGCPIFDTFLRGGIPCNSITELVAESGCGKTQFCLQLALSAQLPLNHHGRLSGSSLYIHTEFPFPFRRLQQLCLDSPIGGNSDNIFVHAAHSAEQLLDEMPKIESFLVDSQSRLPIRLIVVDSIAALFRSEFDNTPSDLKQRSSLFFKISGQLKLLAKRFNVAVVVTNQVVDFMGESGSLNGLRIGNLGSLYSSGRRVCPALGIAWANCVNSRLFLSRNEEVIGAEISSENAGDGLCRRTRRRLYVLFAPHLPESSTEFVIRREGVFGVNR
ncbi:hypothetical protein G4B88_020650 [Cannabis sativa]|uniref:RecA family profile 1 domain-containing protein n=1 Tax=Cannabis sativa TaxID=3483 RepID=A0A7J6HLF9_CANSA|nr:hypothetical protein G4B88_020650 [Cannabis sativa]